MRIDILIDRLTESPGGLMHELVVKREQMVAKSNELQDAIANISKVIRIARDADARQRRSDAEIEALRDALVGQGEIINLDNLYLNSLSPHPPLGGGEG